MTAEDQLILDHLNAIADGFDPHTGAELSVDSLFSDSLVITAVFRTIQAVDNADRSRRMRARGASEEHPHLALGIYSNVWEAAREEFGVKVQGGPTRFGRPGWVQVTAPKVTCPVRRWGGAVGAGTSGLGW